MNVTTLDGGRLLVNVRFLPTLERHGLVTFDKVMACEIGRIRRNFPGRRTSRIELSADDGTSQAVYLKRYLPDYLSAGQRLLRRLHWPGSRDEAGEEWEAIHQLRSLGLRTAEPIAMGQDTRDPNAVTRSFLMTAEVAGSEEGHRFAARLTGGQRRRLLLQIAEMTGTLHRAGWVHKDLYLAHFLVRPGEGGEGVGEPEAVLIDLQRATQPCCFRRRWIVKDLAALAYSTLKAGASRSDIAASFKAYRGREPRSDRQARPLARAVLRRIEWLKTRTPKHDTDFEQLA